MSKYTTEVRFICETAAGLTESAGYSSINTIIDKAIPSVFSFDFPIFDEKYRNVLCRKILKHYYTREICEETVGLWKLRLDTRLNEVMPYFNKLYESELIEFNPMYDTNITRQGNKESVGSDNENQTVERTTTANTTNNVDVTENTENTSYEVHEDDTVETNKNTTNSETEASTSAEHNGNKTERDLYSDTPQGALTNVENETYLTNARKKIGSENNTDKGSSSGSTDTTVEGTSNISSNGNVNVEANGMRESNTKGTATSTGNDTFTSNQNKKANSTEDYLETVVGKQGGPTYSKLLMEYRETFLNIDMQVIESLSDLFFGLW